MSRIVVAGGSVGGTSAAGTLRELGYDGEIVVVDADPRSYPRPSLSKAALRGEDVVDPLDGPSDHTRLRPAHVVGHDPDARTIALTGGETLGYDALIIATGSRAARLAPEREGEFVIRSLTDVEHLRARLAHGSEVVVVGGGLLGIEIASACRELGSSVTLVFRSTPGLRSLGDHVAQWLAAQAVAAGVRLERIDGPAELIGSPVRGVRGADGGMIRADIVITATGDVPNVEWTPLGIPGVGVVTDAAGRAAPNVFAVGDARATRRADGSPVRDPHWYAAIDSGRAAARALLGADRLPPPARFIWTECFGHHIKVAGDPVAGPPTHLEGDPTGPSLALWERHGRTVFAVAIDLKIPVPRLRKRVDVLVAVP